MITAFFWLLWWLTGIAGARLIWVWEISQRGWKPDEKVQLCTATLLGPILLGTALSVRKR